MSKIKAVYNGKDFEIDVDDVLECREIRAKVFLSALKYGKQKEKAIDLILKNRELITKLLKKGDDELKASKKALADDEPLYDRGEIKGARIPFTF